MQKRKLMAVLSIFAFTLFLFLSADFVLTLCGVDPVFLANKQRRLAYKGFIPGTANPYYHHDLKPDIDHEVLWGGFAYRLCTDRNGFKSPCGKKDPASEKGFDIAFMGDSFTEAVGMTYEESFVGLYAAKHQPLTVANMGVSSYCPSTYLKKMEYWLASGMRFKHVVVLPDISDIQDEAVDYIIDRAKGAAVEKEKIPQADLKRIKAQQAADTNFKKMAEQIVAHTQWPDPAKADTRGIWEKHFKFTWLAYLKLHALFYPGSPILSDFDTMHDRAFWTVDPNTPGYGQDGVKGGIIQALEAMAELKSLLDKNNIKMSIMVYPWPAQLIYNTPGHPGVSIWREFCKRENCANFIDANDFFFDQVKRLGLMPTLEKYYIRGDVHFNAEGNRAMFEVMDQKLIP